MNLTEETVILPDAEPLIPRSYRCTNPWCNLATRCPGEVCKICRQQQEAARANFRRVLDQR